MRLIDADALCRRVKAVYEIAQGCGAHETAVFYRALHEEVEQAKTVDAVEVVRCKDCKYAAEIENPYIKDFCVPGVKWCKACRGDTSQGFSESIVLPDDFCNEGERKE